MRFRHEVKFLAKISDVEQFFAELAPYCDHDSHVGITNAYEISSVYYDTKDLRFYMDREESVGYRRKIRLRAYVENQKATALFLEIKEKHKKFVAKKRINLKSMELLDCGIPHDKIPLSKVIEYLEDSAEAREVQYLHNRLELHPVNLIRYIREPLVAKYDHDLRITFDTKVTSGGSQLNIFDKDKEIYLHNPAHGVLEIKTNQSVPTWLQALSKKYPFRHTRFSKYCLGVDAIYGTNRPWVQFGNGVQSQAHQSAEVSYTV